MKTVLVVDDEQCLREVVAAISERLGWRAKQADCAAAALQMAQEEPPDLILADAIIPDMTGMALLKQLKRHPVTRSVPVIMMSGMEFDEDVTRHGASGCLLKPFSMAQLGFVLQQFEWQAPRAATNSYQAHFEPGLSVQVADTVSAGN